MHHNHRGIGADSQRHRDAAAQRFHVQHGDKENVERHVDEAAGGNNDRRTARVAHGAQQRRPHIEQQRRKHGGKVATGIRHTLGQQLMRCIHQHKHRLDKHHAQNGNDNAAHQRERHGRMDRSAQALVIVLTKNWPVITAHPAPTPTQKPMQSSVSTIVA